MGLFTSLFYNFTRRLWFVGLNGLERGSGCESSRHGILGKHGRFLMDDRYILWKASRS